ncbi:unnamed protein product, partial [Amoebophrya sp. A25]
EVDLGTRIHDQLQAYTQCVRANGTTSQERESQSSTNQNIASHKLLHPDQNQKSQPKNLKYLQPPAPPQNNAPHQAQCRLQNNHGDVKNLHRTSSTSSLGVGPTSSSASWLNKEHQSGASSNGSETDSVSSYNTHVTVLGGGGARGGAGAGTIGLGVGGVQVSQNNKSSSGSGSSKSNGGSTTITSGSGETLSCKQQEQSSLSPPDNKQKLGDLRQLQKMAANGLVPGGAETPTFGSRRHSFDSQESYQQRQGVLGATQAQLQNSTSATAGSCQGGRMAPPQLVPNKKKGNNVLQKHDSITSLSNTSVCGAAGTTSNTPDNTPSVCGHSAISVSGSALLDGSVVSFGAQRQKPSLTFSGDVMSAALMSGEKEKPSPGAVTSTTSAGAGSGFLFGAAPGSGAAFAGAAGTTTKTGADTTKTTETSSKTTYIFYCSHRWSVWWRSVNLNRRR